MAFVAVYDANVLYPNTLRNLLIRIAQLPHLVQAKWTEEILAAAIKAKAQIIVTKNLRDFPGERLAPWDLKAKSPDSFVRDQIDIDRQAVWASSRLSTREPETQ